MLHILTIVFATIIFAALILIAVCQHTDALALDESFDRKGRSNL